jgi:hypothetical protein
MLKISFLRNLLRWFLSYSLDPVGSVGVVNSNSSKNFDCFANCERCSAPILIRILLFVKSLNELCAVIVLILMTAKTIMTEKQIGKAIEGLVGIESRRNCFQHHQELTNQS